MWEIIEKNKQKSLLALSLMGLWYSLVYGLIFAIIAVVVAMYIYPEQSVIDNMANDSVLAFNIYCAGILIALFIFIVRFLFVKKLKQEI